MSDFVDLHLHLLPEVDDGCRSMADTLAMAKALVALGVTRCAPSPHNRAEYASADVCAQRLVEVRQALQTEGLALELHTNSENFFLDETLLVKAATPEGRRIGEAGKYLLVEAPYTSPLPALKDIIFRFKLKGLTPVIAHPERCFEFERPGRAAEAVNAGALLQMDIGALIGRYGKQAQKLALKFLHDDLYSLVATDLHSPVGAEAWVGSALQVLEKQGGRVAVQRLFSENPLAILQGRSVG